ncbi:hypothetical protein MMC25_003670 [Agyrium rufum]|nr:hypothetical protein [Agyrium rufum]
MSINSIITPRTDYAVGTDASWPSKIPVQLGPGRPGFFYGLHPSDETTSYSSDSCHSPISEGPTAQLYPQPYLPQYQNPPSHSSPYPMDIQPTHFPHVYGNPPVEPGWNEFDDRHVIDDNLGIGLEGQFPNSVGTQSRTSRALLGGGRIAKYLRRSLSISPWNDTTSNAVVRLNDSTIQHYYDCYWKYFHDVCSVVHFATFMSTDRSTVLAKTMLAIGSQFSPRPLSGSHSITFFGDSIRLLDEINNQGNPITSRYPLVFLQTIVLQEAFALYRSRHAGVYRSPAFSSLYSSLLNNRKQLDSDPAEDYDLSDENLSAEDLQKIHISWADQEARRRLLLAAFVHDTQRDVFFPLKSRRPTATKQARQLPLPCDEPLWNALDAPSWRSILQASRAQSIPSVNPASNILSAPVSSIGKHPMTPHVTPPPSQTKSSIIPSAGGVSFQGTIDRCVSIQHHTIPSSKTTATTPVSDALLMATNTPIQSLLTVAAECWLYANKVEERSTWLAAKSELRTWVDSGNVSAKAVWHAVQLLRAAFPPASVTDNRTTRMEKARRGSMALGLAENWCLYLAALVCWAYGFQSRSKQGVDRFVPEKSVNAGSGLGSCDLTAPRKKPRLRRTREVASVKEEEEKEALNELGMIEYIEIVQRGKWMNVDKMKGKGGTNGMLIEVRHRLAENESWGRLGCEAEGVLGRLIDGRGGWEF